MIKKYFIIGIFLFVAFLLPAFFSYAQNNPGADRGFNPGNDVGVNSGTDRGCSPGQGVVNPLSFCTIQQFFDVVLSFLIQLAIPLIIFMIIFTGFKFVIARGNTTKLEEARMMFFYTILGGLLILGASIITRVLRGTVDSISFADFSVVTPPPEFFLQAQAVGSASSLQRFSDVTDIIVNFFTSLFPILIGLAVVVFFWGLIKYIAKAGNTESHEEGKQIMLWGIIALFVMVSVWGVILFAQRAIFGRTLTPSAGQVQTTNPNTPFPISR